jgi:predicted CXXCH cytochrome family protein
MALLQKRPLDVCVECHPDVLKKPHALGGTSHPLGSGVTLGRDYGKGREKKERVLMDPARPEKEFYCGSCHNPHSSDSNGLIRYAIRNRFELCINCHKK